MCVVEAVALIRNDNNKMHAMDPGDGSSKGARGGGGGGKKTVGRILKLGFAARFWVGGWRGALIGGGGCVVFGMTRAIGPGSREGEVIDLPIGRCGRARNSWLADWRS